MRILHTSDWHLGRNLEQVNRLAEQKEFIDFLCRTVEEEKIDLVLVAGDIYDTYNPSAQAEQLFYQAIEGLNGGGRRAVVVIAGNHDNPDRLCAASPLSYKDGIILLGYPGSNPAAYTEDVKDKTGKRADTDQGANGSDDANAESIRIMEGGPGWMELSIPGCSHNAVILTMPYPSESRLEELLSADADEGMLQKAYSEKIGSVFSSLSRHFRNDTVNLIVTHIFLLGGKESDSERTLQVGGALTVDPTKLPENAHYAALGHLHRPQEIKGSACPAFYSGSPLAYSFSEAEHSKAVYIIEAIPGEKAVITPVYLNCGKPLRRWVAENGYGQALQWCEEGRDKNAWVDLEIVTDRVLTMEEQKNLRSLHPGIIYIRPRIIGEAADALSPESREGKKIDELFKDYYRYRTGTDISEELMNAFLEIVNNQEDDGAEDADIDGKDTDDDADGAESANVDDPDRTADGNGGMEGSGDHET